MGSPDEFPSLLTNAPILEALTLIPIGAFVIAKIILAPNAIPNPVPAQILNTVALAAVVAPPAATAAFTAHAHDNWWLRMRSGFAWESIVVLVAVLQVIEANRFLPRVAEPNISLTWFFFIAGSASVYLVAWATLTRRAIAVVATVVLVVWHCYTVFGTLLRTTPHVVALILLLIVSLVSLCLLARIILHQRTRIATLYRDLERALSSMVEQEKNESMARIAAGLAHEINNPVNYLLGDLQFLKQHVRTLVDRVGSRRNGAPPDDEALQRAIRDSGEILANYEHGLDRITHAVAGLRSLTREERGAIERVQVAELAEKLDRHLRSNSLPGVDPGETLTISLPAGTDLVWLGRHMDLWVVMSNLVENAFEAVDAASVADPAVYLTIEHDSGGRSSEHRSGISVVVDDNGPGVGPGDISKNFEPFSTTKLNEKNLGIGLHMVQRIAAAYGGEVTCGRSEHGGAHFRVWLPDVLEPGDRSRGGSM